MLKTSPQARRSTKTRIRSKSVSVVGKGKGRSNGLVTTVDSLLLLLPRKKASAMSSWVICVDGGGPRLLGIATAALDTKGGGAIPTPEAVIMVRGSVEDGKGVEATTVGLLLLFFCGPEGSWAWDTTTGGGGGGGFATEASG